MNSKPTAEKVTTTVTVLTLVGSVILKLAPLGVTLLIHHAKIAAAIEIVRMVLNH